LDPASIAAALEASALGEWMRGGGWSYAAVNVAHLLGLALLVGPILLLDLRLLGFGRQFSAQAVSRALTPFAATGLLVALLSGIALFSADANALIGNRLMQMKLLAIALGLLNVALFHALWSRHLHEWDRVRPRFARVSALLSIGLWLAVPIAGRLIAYV
jgi:hypothetical protein